MNMIKICHLKFSKNKYKHYFKTNFYYLLFSTCHHRTSVIISASWVYLQCVLLWREILITSCSTHPITCKNIKVTYATTFSSSAIMERTGVHLAHNCEQSLENCSLMRHSYKIVFCGIFKICFWWLNQLQQTSLNLNLMMYSITVAIVL